MIAYDILIAKETQKSETPKAAKKAEEQKATPPSKEKKEDDSEEPTKDEVKDAVQQGVVSAVLYWLGGYCTNTHLRCRTQTLRRQPKLRRRNRRNDFKHMKFIIHYSRGTVP